MTQILSHDIELFAKQASDRFIERGEPLNFAIKNIAQLNDLNNEQIKRVVEKANTYVNGELVKEAKEKKADPRITFERASAESIITSLERPDEEEMDKLASMFVVGDDVAVTDASFEKVAKEMGLGEDTEPFLSDKSSLDLARAYMFGTNLAKNEAFSHSTIVDARDNVAEVLKLAQNGHLDAALDFEEAQQHIYDAAESAMLSELLTPNTLRHVVSTAKLPEGTVKIAHEMIKQAQDQTALPDGVNTVVPGTIVDHKHPLFSSMEEMHHAAHRMIKSAQTIQCAEMALEAVEKDVVASRGKVAFVPLGTVAKGTAGVVGKALGGLSAAQNIAGAYQGAAGAAKRLKVKQMTPVVGPMKLASTGAALQKAFTAAGIAALGATAAVAADKMLGLAGNQIGGMFERREQTKRFQKLVQMHPEFGSNPNAEKYFKMIVQYAPGIAKNEVAVADFLRKQLMYPATSVEFLKALVDFQKVYNETHSRGSNPIAGAFGKSFAENLK